MGRTAPQISLPLIQIDHSLNIPAYEQVYGCIKDAILTGRLKPDDRLPTTRLVAEEIGISRNVIIMAFEQLKMEGYINSRPGSGSFVSQDIVISVGRDGIKEIIGKEQKESLLNDRDANRFSKGFLERLQLNVLLRNTGKEPVVPFQTAVPAFDQFPFVIWSKLAAKAYRFLNFQHLGYDDVAGYLPLREAIADNLRVNRAVNCTADRILIVNGAQQALTMIAQLLLEPGDAYWIEDPGYVNAKATLSVFGGKPCPVPVTSMGINIDFAFKTFPHAKLAYITPSNQYPLGGTLPLPQRLKLLKWAQENDLWLIEDDYDSELRYKGKPIPSLQGLDQYGNVIYMGTFSKVLFPALRMAYLVLPDAGVAHKFKLVKALNDRQSALIDQMILTDFIKEGYYNRHIRKMRVLYDARLQFLLHHLTKHLGRYLSFSDPSAGMHLAAYFKRPVTEELFFQKVKENKLIVHNIKDYTIEHYTKPGILLGYASFPEKELLNGILRLKEIFKDMTN